jgi:cytochrome P450
MRAEGPLVPNGANAWVTGRYDVVNALLHDSRSGKAYLETIRTRYGDDGPDRPVFQSMSRMLFAINLPMHTQLRALLVKAFTAQQLTADA